MGLAFLSLLVAGIALGVAYRSRLQPSDNKSHQSVATEEPSPAVAPFDAAKAKELQEAWAKHLGVPVEFENAIGMKFRLIPPGEFTMGSTPAEREEAAKKLIRGVEQLPNEAQAHAASIAAPYYLGVHEVTVGQFRSFVRATNYKTTAEANGGSLVLNPETQKMEPRQDRSWKFVRMAANDRWPVCAIAWPDAHRFCEWLEEEDGIPYRLPTDVEWELACRAGSITRWPWSDDPAPAAEYANFGKFRQPVGSLRPNAFGLFDMLGNAYELTFINNATLRRAGGSWWFDPWGCRPASRAWIGVEEASNDDGFRVAIGGDLRKVAEWQVKR